MESPSSFFNICSDDLYLDALITELFLIYIVANQTLGEGILKGVCWCVEGKVGDSVWSWGLVNSQVSIWCLVIGVILMRFRGAKRWKKL